MREQHGATLLSHGFDPKRLSHSLEAYRLNIRDLLNGLSFAASHHVAASPKPETAPRRLGA